MYRRVYCFALTAKQTSNKKQHAFKKLKNYVVSMSYENSPISYQSKNRKF